MRNFQIVAAGLDPLPTLLELHRQPDLWNANRARREQPGGPHGQTDDLWIRWRNGIDAQDDGEAHDLTFLPAWHALPSLRPLVFGLMARCQAVQLGAILLTRIPPGGRVLPHVDGGWHAKRFETKVYVVLQGNPACVNRTGEESLVMQPGTAWAFRNDIIHSVSNDGEDALTCRSRDADLLLQVRELSATYPAAFRPLEAQPEETDVRLLSGTFVKEVRVAKAGTALPQHAHTFAHVSVIVRGAVRLYQDQTHVGDFHAPCGVLIPALAKHLFVTMCDNTVILCVHDGDADVADEHVIKMEA